MTVLVIILSILNYTIPKRNLKINSFLREEWLQMDSDSLTPGFREAVRDMDSISDLYLLDSLMLSNALYSKSDLVESELIKLIKNDNKFIHSTIANHYAKHGIQDLNAGDVDRGLHELNFALQLDPSRSSIPIILMKYNFSFRDLENYFSTYRFLNNKIRLIVNIMFLFIIFLVFLYFALVISGLFRSVPFLSEWVRQRMGIDDLWVPALLFAFFVWFPILTFLAILVGISLVKMTKKLFIRLAIISVIFPLTVAYINNIRVNFSSNSPAYHSFKARYDPYNYSINEPESPYGYAVKGIELARMGELSKSESLFQKGYNSNENLIFMVNLSSVYFSKGKYDESLNLCKKIISLDHDNPITNLTIANIYLIRLDFEEASIYLDRVTKSGSKFADRELPIYKYPPDTWLLSEIFGLRGIGQFIKGSKLYVSFILMVLFLILSFVKRLKDEFCPICDRILIKGVKIEGEKVCDICANKLTITESKSIRKRLKRLTKKKSHRMAIIKNFTMNLILPGTAHIYKNIWLVGIGLLLLGSVLLVIYIGPFYTNSGEIIRYETSTPNSIYRYIIILYYLLVSFLTWRLSADGDRR